jgi:hypothetical protein
MILMITPSPYGSPDGGHRKEYNIHESRVRAGTSHLVRFTLNASYAANAPRRLSVFGRYHKYATSLVPAFDTSETRGTALRTA